MTLTKPLVCKWEHQYYPNLVFPASEVPKKFLHSTSAGDENADIHDIVVGDKRAKNAAIIFKAGVFQSLIKIVFGAMDVWFKEDDQIFVHPKDPYKVKTLFKIVV
ncbi:hypothetical protein EW146_g4830 [Bondarzewia mesenterica]|uniref:Uncharacterized protein n=1 Tax=Bondarzewia mesenterica TaxID=1095465 RepID=A0A4S4LZ24_9AGAM|nr:hypothetical protein EW146_g4830 [Bondarzewia mesenterica]